jgi:hypothetical protein
MFPSYITNISYVIFVIYFWLEYYSYVTEQQATLLQREFGFLLTLTWYLYTCFL